MNTEVIDLLKRQVEMWKDEKGLHECQEELWLKESADKTLRAAEARKNVATLGSAIELLNQNIKKLEAA